MTDDRTAEDALEIARLAALPLLEYGRERKPAAKRLGVPVSMLDRLVAGARGDPTPGQGRALDLREPEPWPEAADGAVLLDGIVTEIRRYVVFGAAAADAVPLWVAADHAFDRFVIFPRLFITAPEKGCGKTTLLDAISRLVTRALAADNITAAALFRTIEAVRPTLLLDEADSYLRDNEDLRGILDSGHRRDGGVIRTVGDTYEPRRFSTFAPVVLAAIGHLPGTIAVPFVLTDGILDVLPGQRVLQLGGEDRDAVQEQHEVEAVLVLRAVVELAHDREEARPVEPPRLLVKPARRLEIGGGVGWCVPATERRASHRLRKDAIPAALADWVSRCGARLEVNCALSACYMLATSAAPEWLLM